MHQFSKFGHPEFHISFNDTGKHQGKHEKLACLGMRGEKTNNVIRSNNQWAYAVEEIMTSCANFSILAYFPVIWLVF